MSVWKAGTRWSGLLMEPLGRPTLAIKQTLARLGLVTLTALMVGPGCAATGLAAAQRDKLSASVWKAC